MFLRFIHLQGAMETPQHGIGHKKRKPHQKVFFFEAFPVFFKNFRKFLKSNFSFKLLLNKITVKFYICMIKCKQPKMLLALYSPFHVKFRF